MIPRGWAATVLMRLENRQSVGSAIIPAVQLTEPPSATGWQGAVFNRLYRPPIRLLILGSGPEALAVAALAKASRVDALLLATRHDVAEQAEAAGLPLRLVHSPACPPELVDDATAILCLTHEAEWDVPFLADALSTPAVFVGALGSPRAHVVRLDALAALGIDAQAAARIRSPVGAVPATRDSRALAFSVLAEVMAVATNQGLTGG